MGDKLPIELIGLLKAFLLGMISCVVLAGVIYYTNLAETLLAPLGKIVLIASVFYAGCYCTKSYGNKGLVRGITMGILFFIILLIASLIFQAAPIHMASFIVMLASCVGAGAVGGILGIGLSDQ